MKCNNCVDGWVDRNGTHDVNCPVCHGTQRRDPDFCIPMFEAHGPVRELIYVGGAAPMPPYTKPQAMRYTLYGARELVKQVKNKLSWFDNKPNSIVRVYLK